MSHQLRRAKRRRPMSEINVVPYIDVMLVLLVIFMVTTPLLSQGVKVKLPKVGAKTIDTKQQEPIIVTVNSQGNYYLNIAAKPKHPLSPIIIRNRVASALQQAKSRGQKRQVLVKGDTHVSYGKVVAAMVLLQQAGAPSVGLITQPPAKGKG